MESCLLQQISTDQIYHYYIIFVHTSEFEICIFILVEIFLYEYRNPVTKKMTKVQQVLSTFLRRVGVYVRSIFSCTSLPRRNVSSHQK